MNSEITLSNIFDFQKNNESLFTELSNSIAYINSEFKSISKNVYDNKKIPIFDFIYFVNKDKSKPYTYATHIIVDLLTHFSNPSTNTTQFNANLKTHITFESYLNELSSLEKNILFSSVLFYIKFNVDIYKYINLNEIKDVFELNNLNLRLDSNNYYSGENSLSDYSNSIYNSTIVREDNSFKDFWCGVSSFSKIKPILKKGALLSLKENLHSYDKYSMEHNFFKICTSNNGFLSNFTENTQKELKKIINDVQPKTNCSYDLSNKMAIKIFEISLPKKLTHKYYKETLNIIIEKNKKITTRTCKQLFLSSLVKKYGFENLYPLKYLNNDIYDFISGYFSYDKDLISKIKNLHSLENNIIYMLIQRHFVQGLGNSLKNIIILTSIAKFPEDRRKELFDLILSNELFDKRQYREFDLDSLKLALSSNDLARFYKVIYAGISKIAFDSEWRNFIGLPSDTIKDIKSNYFHEYFKKTVFFSYSKERFDDEQFSTFGYSYSNNDDMETLYNNYLETKELALNC